MAGRRRRSAWTGFAELRFWLDRLRSRIVFGNVSPGLPSPPSRRLDRRAPRLRERAPHHRGHRSELGERQAFHGAGVPRAVRLDGAHTWHRREGDCLPGIAKSWCDRRVSSTRSCRATGVRSDSPRHQAWRRGMCRTSSDTIYCQVRQAHCRWAGRRNLCPGRSGLSEGRRDEQLRSRARSIHTTLWS